MARLAAVLVVVAVLSWAPAAAARPHGSLDEGPRAERGIVQSIGARWLTMRTLDGATMLVRVDAHTHVLVDHRRATLRDIRRGFVVIVKFDEDGGYAAGDAAREIQAFGGIEPGVAGGPGQPPKSNKQDRPGKRNGTR